MFEALIADALERESNSWGCYWCCQRCGPCLYFRGAQFDFLLESVYCLPLSVTHSLLTPVVETLLM